MFSVLLTDTARRFYESVDARLQRRFDRCFRLLRESPLRHPNVKPLRGRWAGYYRFRLGDYRIVYGVDAAERLVIVAAIAHRREAYE